MEIKLEMKTMSKISGALLCSMLLSSIFSGLIVSGVEVIRVPLSAQTIQIIGAGISSAGYLYFFHLFTKNMKKRDINAVSLKRKLSIYDGVSYLLLLLGATTTLSKLTDYIVHYIKVNLINGEINSKGVVESFIGNVPIFIILLFVVIISPIFEELLFRKVLLELLLPYGKVTAIMVSGLLFGLYHANLEQLLYTIFLGMLCANIVIISGEIKYAIYLHILFNLFGAIISDYIPNGIITIVLQVVFITGAVLVLIFRMKTLFVFKDDGNKKDFFRKKEFLSIGFIFYIVFYVICSIGAMSE